MGAHHHTRILVFCIYHFDIPETNCALTLSLSKREEKQKTGPVMWTRPGHIARAPPQPHSKINKNKKKSIQFSSARRLVPTAPVAASDLRSLFYRKQDAATRLAPPKILFVRRRDPHKLHTQPRRPFKSITSLISLQFSRGEEAAGKQSVDRHAEEPRQASGARRR